MWLEGVTAQIEEHLMPSVDTEPAPPVSVRLLVAVAEDSGDSPWLVALGEEPSYAVEVMGDLALAISAVRRTSYDCVVVAHEPPAFDAQLLIEQLQSWGIPAPPVVLVGAPALGEGQRPGRNRFVVRLGSEEADDQLVGLVEELVEASRCQRLAVLEAEYRYAAVAYRGYDEVPTFQQLTQFAVASSFARLLGGIRRTRSSTSAPRNSLNALKARRNARASRPPHG